MNWRGWIAGLILATLGLGLWSALYVSRVSVVAATAAPNAAMPAAVGQPEYAPGVVLVKVRTGVVLTARPNRTVQAARPALDAALAEVGARGSQPVFAGAPATGLGRVYRLALAPATTVLSAVAALAANPDLEWVEPDYRARPAVTPNDPLYAGQWGLVQIAAPAAWEMVTGTAQVVIAVVDSGMDTAHSDLVANLWVNPGEVPSNGVDDDNNGYVDDVYGWNFVSDDNDITDSYGHGTQVAGVLAAVTDNGLGGAGVCWHCRIMPVKVMADSGLSNYSDVAAGVRYAADKGAQVINLSLGGYAYSNALREAVEYATSQGAVVVGGAGNDSVNTPFYPAAYERVLAVAGTTRTDTKALSSNYGVWVDLDAPAVEITTTYLGGDWGPASGTSMAAPFVAGVAALIRSRQPGWSAALVRNQLVQTADPLDTLNPAYAGQLGAGRVNAAQAMQDPRPALVLAGTSVNGDPAGRPTPGTTVALTATLRNDWWDAISVTGTLTTADAFVTLEQATASYGTLASGATGANTPVYTFTVAAGAGYNHTIPFTLAVTANGGAYTTTLPLTITTRSGDEPFCGTIAEDLVWTSDKRYIINCNVGVAPGYTLTIQAGTEVRFNGNYTLNVGGALIADGTAAQPIRFMPHTDGDWAGLLFDDSSIDARATVGGTYLSGNLMRYTWIESATQGISCMNATPYLEHVTLTGGGMVCAGGDTSLWVQESNLSGDMQVSIGSEVDSVQGTWITRTSMPTVRAGLAAAAAPNGKLYAIGGSLSGGNHLDTVEEYDPTTDTWTARAPMPTARAYLAVATASNGQLYAIGGSSSGGFLATVEAYDPLTDTWTTRAPMSTARAYLAVVAAPNGKLYAIGGYNGSHLATVEEYDPATDTWTTRTSMPTVREGLAAAAAPDGWLYAIGGARIGGALATVEAYDPATDTWTTRTPMPTVREYLAVAAAPNGRLYAIGGYGHSGWLKTVEEYNPATDIWTARTPMLTVRGSLAVAAAPSGQLYAMGGYNNNGTWATVEEFMSPTENYGYHVLRSTLHGSLSLPGDSEVLSNTADGSITIDGGGMIADSRANGNLSLGNGWALTNTVTSGGISIGKGLALNNLIRGGSLTIGGGVARNNNIENVPDWGIQASGNTILEYNRVVGCANGIQASGGTTQNNLIANTAGVGLELGAATTVLSNTFTGIGGSAVKLTAGTAMTLTGNNFEFNPGAYDVEDQVSQTTLLAIDARNNWWGTTNGAAIQQRIFDFNDNYTIGTVLYSPVLTQPSTTAPAYMRAVTLTPESPVGIETVTFEVLFSREMDTQSTPELTFIDSFRAPMPTAREWVAVAAAPNGRLYAIGGNNSSILTTVEEYNPVTNTWAVRTPMPTARSVLAVATALNGKIYAIGGYNENHLATVEEYDPATDTWAARAPMPTARYALAVAAAPNGWLYAIGGCGSSGCPVTTVEAYNPATDTWMPRASLPTARFGLVAAAAANGKLYAIGGTNGSYLGTVEEYDPATNTWRARASMPTPRSALAVAVAPDGQLYVVGGDNNGPLATVEAYNPATDTWTVLAPLHTARSALAAAGANGRLYAIGGWNGIGYLATVEAFTGAHAEFYGGTWSAPTRYRAAYDFSTLISRGVYNLTVAGAQGTDGITIAPNSATTFTMDYLIPIGDTTPPLTPAVAACSTATLDTLSAQWRAHDQESAITQYRYAIGTTAGGGEVVNWTITTTTAITRTNLTLLAGQTYYISIKACNEGGLWSEKGVSGGVVAGSAGCTQLPSFPLYLPLVLRLHP